MNLARSRSMIVLLLTVATAAIASAAEESDVEQLHVVLLADEKDHGPEGNGLHDYPLWQKRWALLLGGEKASNAKEHAEWKSTLAPLLTESEERYVNPGPAIPTGYGWVVADGRAVSEKIEKR